MNPNSTICAVATATGGALGVVRVSGADAIAIVDRLFVPHRGESLTSRLSHRLVFGTILDNDGTSLDEVLVSVFRAPHSFTGDDSVEISCHGSTFILRRLLQLLQAAGCELAAPGEFTQRAFLNGRMDLSQAEAVADLIASTTAANHRIAMNQMRGDFSRQLGSLRDRLLHLTSLLELELDFSDHDDLEFANRSELFSLATEVESVTACLADSFSMGNALKNGLPVAIVGSTNAGKSTLLNALLHDERAIVSDVHGTTRDVIEDTYIIGGTLFRFIDTAGLRTTTDTVEQMGIERSWTKLSEAEIVLFVVDSTDADRQLTQLSTRILELAAQKSVVVVFNKSDLLELNVSALQQRFFAASSLSATTHVLSISAHSADDIDRLTALLSQVANNRTEHESDVIVTNARHHAALVSALADIRRVRDGLQQQLSNDLISQDLRECLFHLAEITGGAITTDEVLGTIFQKFCIGK